MIASLMTQKPEYYYEILSEIENPIVNVIHEIFMESSTGKKYTLLLWKHVKMILETWKLQISFQSKFIFCSLSFLSNQERSSLNVLYVFEWKRTASRIYHSHSQIHIHFTMQAMRILSHASNETKYYSEYRFVYCNASLKMIRWVDIWFYVDFFILFVYWSQLEVWFRSFWLYSPVHLG